MNSRLRAPAPLLAAALALWAIGLLPAQAGAATPKRTAPLGFIGSNLDAWDLLDAGINLDNELKVAAASGIEKIRLPIYWHLIQPDGPGTYDWADLDKVVGAAAKSRIPLAPNVLSAPRWAWDSRYRPDSSNPCASSRSLMPVPRDFNEFAAFMKTLVGRYGPNGTFWTANPTITKTPIREWQIWNEPDLVRTYRGTECTTDPNLATYWPQHIGESFKSVTIRGRTTRIDLRWAPSMVSLVRTSRTAIKQADPGAVVLFPSLTNQPWLSLDLVYYSGGKGAFDRVGINLFTKLSNFVRAFTTSNSSTSPWSSSILGALSRGKDTSMQVALTEFTWATAVGRNSNLEAGDRAWSLPNSITTESGQGALASSALSTLVANRTKWKLADVQWYTWSSTDPARSSNLFDFAGLSAIVLDPLGMRRKPGLTAFRTRAMLLEGCKTKLVASACATR